MSAEILRRAAALMREQHGPEHKRHKMWAAMADWLEDEARFDDAARESGGRGWGEAAPCVRVAHAYLGGDA